MVILEGSQTSEVYAIVHDVLNVEGGRVSQKKVVVLDNFIQHELR